MAYLFEYKVLTISPNDINIYFMMQYISGRRNEIRKKIIKCSALIKTLESGTRALHKHHEIHSWNEDVLHNQTVIPFKKVKIAAWKGVDELAKLFYENGMSFTRSFISGTLQTFFRSMNIATVSYHSINSALESGNQTALN